MAKKPRQAAPPKNRHAPRQPAEPTAVGAQNVILERIEEQQRVVIETVTMTRDALRREIGELRDELTSKIDVLEVAVRANSADIRRNSADIVRLSEKLDSKAEAGRVDSLEQRVSTLEVG